MRVSWGCQRCIAAGFDRAPRLSPMFQNLGRRVQRFSRIYPKILRFPPALPASISVVRFPVHRPRRIPVYSSTYSARPIIPSHVKAKQSPKVVSGSTALSSPPHRGDVNDSELLPLWTPGGLGTCTAPTSPDNAFLCHTSFQDTVQRAQRFNVYCTRLCSLRCHKYPVDPAWGRQ